MVATALAGYHAPVARPLEGIPPTRDTETGFTVTLWERIDSDPERVVTPSEVGESLRELHRALARYEGDLPSFEASLDLARAALADDEVMKSLPDPDRSLLRRAFDRLRAELRMHSYAEQPLHGEAHDGNRLSTPDGVRWIDLEGVCVGPLEWDLAFLPQDAIDAFPNVDTELLGILRTLNSARVATWCWVRWDFAEMRWHAEHHLEQVRRAEARPSSASGFGDISGARDRLGLSP